MKARDFLSILCSQNDFAKLCQKSQKYFMYLVNFIVSLGSRVKFCAISVKYLFREMIVSKFCEFLRNPFHLLRKFVILLVLQNKIYKIQQILLDESLRNFARLFREFREITKYKFREISFCEIFLTTLVPVSCFRARSFSGCIQIRLRGIGATSRIIQSPPTPYQLPDSLLIWSQI